MRRGSWRRRGGRSSSRSSRYSLLHVAGVGGGGQGRVEPGKGDDEARLLEEK